MPYCPNGHGEKNGKFCDECPSELVSHAPGDSVRVRSPEFGTIHQHVYGAGAPQPVSPPRQSNSGLVVLLVALLVVVGGAATWLALNRTQPGRPAVDPLAVVVAATLTAQTLPAPSTPPAPDGTATAAFATAQAVVQQPTASPVASLLDAAATQTPVATAIAQPTETPNLDATVQSRVAATLAAQPTVTSTGIPAATPDLAAAVAAALAATQTAQQAAQPAATTTPNVDATVQSRVAATLAAQPTATPTDIPAATPDLAAAVAIALAATQTAQQAAQPAATTTPNVDATVQSRVAVTLTSVARSQPTATRIPKINATLQAGVAILTIPQQTATAAAATVIAFRSVPTPTLPPTPDTEATAVFYQASAINAALAAGFDPNEVDVDSTTGFMTAINSVDGAIYVYIPEGEFTMGSTLEDDEEPIHKVYLDGFWIMQTEVTNGQYGRCVAVGDCGAPGNTVWGDYPNLPVVNVSWEQARDYANWVGGQLPTEAQWEKACRSADGRIYPWGNSAPNNNLLNFGESRIEYAVAVGSYPDGASPYGLLDMAGNVWEWTADWYDENYYSQSSKNNPTGPVNGEDHVLRGGSWEFYADPRCASRLDSAYYREAGYDARGFRVVAVGGPSR